jgi:hypothetical protein
MFTPTLLNLSEPLEQHFAPTRSRKAILPSSLRDVVDDVTRVCIVEYVLGRMVSCVEVKVGSTMRNQIYLHSANPNEVRIYREGLGRRASTETLIP